MTPILFEVPADSHHPHEGFQFAYSESAIIFCADVLCQEEYGVWEYVIDVLVELSDFPRSRCVVNQPQISTPMTLVSRPGHFCLQLAVSDKAGLLIYV